MPNAGWDSNSERREGKGWRGGGKGGQEGGRGVHYQLAGEIRASTMALVVNTLQPYLLKA